MELPKEIGTDSSVNSFQLVMGSYVSHSYLFLQCVYLRLINGETDFDMYLSLFGCVGEWFQISLIYFFDIYL